jgi:predicted nuclease with TOPRIM domain
MADDLKQFSDEIKRHFDVTAESLRSEIRQVAEGLISLDDKTERGFADVRREFDEVKAMIKFSHAELPRRLDTHEHDIADLRDRIERLERKPSRNSCSSG